MIFGLKRSYIPILVSMLLFLWGCEPFYDPVLYEDVPTSPGSVWDKEPLVVKETTDIPFKADDLSGTMPLSRLLDIALYNNPSTRLTWNAARAAAYAYHVSLSPYYPTLEFSGSLDAQTNKGSTFASTGPSIVTTSTTATTVNAHSVNQQNELTLTYLLLDFGGRDAAAEFALQALYSANWQHDFTMQQVMLSVLTAYTSYLGNKGLVIGYEQDLKDAEVVLNSAKVMREAGLATLTDVLLAQSTLETTRTNWLQAQGAEKTSFGEILISIGLPPDTQIAVENLPQKLPVVQISGNLSSLLDLAKQKRPDLGVAVAVIKQQEAQLAISYSNGMPILTANADWNQVRFISPRKPSAYTEVASIELSFPLFQGFYFMNQQRQLRAQIEEAIANLDVQVAAVSTQVLTAYYSYVSAAAALPSAEAAVEYSLRAFKGFVVQYKTGTASILDVLNTLTALSNARAQLVVIRTQWALSLANLAFAVGVLEDTSGVWKEAPPKEMSQIPIRDTHDADSK